MAFTLKCYTYTGGRLKYTVQEYPDIRVLVEYTGGRILVGVWASLAVDIGEYQLAFDEEIDLTEYFLSLDKPIIENFMGYFTNTHNDNYNSRVHVNFYNFGFRLVENEAFVACVNRALPVVLLNQF